MVGLAWSYRIGGWLMVGQVVAGPWHDAISGTFGDGAIVTGDIRRSGE
jgi:hypothetical protein